MKDGSVKKTKSSVSLPPGMDGMEREEAERIGRHD
jgi:hypothetical protein